jgi:hypothetical protein
VPPLRRVPQHAPEIGDSNQIAGELRAHELPNRPNDDLRIRRRFLSRDGVLEGDVVQVRGTVPCGGYDRRVQDGVTPEGVSLVDVVPVGLDLGLLGVARGPVWIEFA